MKSLKVINDIAERGVKMMSDFTNVITIDKKQREHLLQAVEHHRQNFENLRKSCLNEYKQFCQTVQLTQYFINLLICFHANEQRHYEQLLV